MILYLLLLAVLTVNGAPLEGQPIKRTPLVYYTHPTSQYVAGGLYPYIQYPGYTPPLGKALQSIQSPNDLIFYPNTLAPQPLVFNPHTVPVAPRFTAPPNGLVDAIYAWFAENNLAIPDDPRKNEAVPEKENSPKDPEKVETPEKPEAGEAEVLAEADKNYPKKVTPNFKPGQRFYILNGQPQFFGNYQPSLPRVQPVVPQLLTRSGFPADTQNILYLQPEQPQVQQPEKLKKPASQESQNIVSLRNANSDTQAESELAPQNYVLLQETQQNPAHLKVQNQELVQNYPQQQIYLGRLLQQGQDIKSEALQHGYLQQQISQTPIHQTHYVPVEVVPPQVPNIHSQIQYQNQELQRPELPAQQLSFIHIPVDRNVQPPQYIKSIVPIQINAKTQVPQIPLIPEDIQQRNSGNILYLRAPVDAEPENQQVQQQQQQQQEQQENIVPPGVAALEFARYIASRQHEDIYSDSVVVEAKDEAEEEVTKEPEAPQQPEEPAEPEEPSIAQAQPGGIALAGVGGVASSAPRGTALVGDKGLAVASPQATAVAGPDNDKADSKPKRRYV